jgi:nitrate/nitrite transport system substrate-binding protein
MPIYDQPFDPDRPLRPGCFCGRHRSPAEHDYEAGRTMLCEPVASQERTYEGVVASAVMRKVFPKDAARRCQRPLKEGQSPHAD